MCVSLCVLLCLWLWFWLCAHGLACMLMLAVVNFRFVRMFASERVSYFVRVNECVRLCQSVYVGLCTSLRFHPPREFVNPPQKLSRGGAGCPKISLVSDRAVVFIPPPHWEEAFNGAWPTQFVTRQSFRNQRSFFGGLGREEQS